MLACYDARLHVSTVPVSVDDAHAFDDTFAHVQYVSVMMCAAPHAHVRHSCAVPLCVICFAVHVTGGLASGTSLDHSGYVTFIASPCIPMVSFWY